MDEENIFTMASVKRVPVSPEDIEAAEIGISTEDSIYEARRARLVERYALDKVRTSPEYKEFLDFVMRRNVPGIHPDDVLPRWTKMFGRLAPGQLSAILTALEIDHALDNPTHGGMKRVREAVEDNAAHEVLLRQLIRAELNGMHKEIRESESRSYKGREYRASRGSISALKKKGGSKKKAVKAGSFDWASEPYAAARAAEIVSTGKARGRGKKS